ncbi:hypothetical protein KJ966_15005 [bacterium]|nr:hypothetical protein [bacterium]
MHKASSALGISIVSQVISLTGYIKPIEQVIDGTARLVKQEQSAEFILTLKKKFAILSIVFLCIFAYNIFRYRLTPDIHNRLNMFSTARRSGAAFDADERENIECPARRIT